MKETTTTAVEREKAGKMFELNEKYKDFPERVSEYEIDGKKYIVHSRFVGKALTIPTFCAILKMSVWYCFDLKGVIMAKQTIYNAGIYVRLSQEDMRAGESLSIENQDGICQGVFPQKLQIVQ